MDNEDPNADLKKAVCEQIIWMDPTKPDWFLQEARKSRKLALELELARNKIEKLERTPRSEYPRKVDPRREATKMVKKIPPQSELQELVKLKVQKAVVEALKAEQATTKEPEAATVEKASSRKKKKKTTTTKDASTEEPTAAKAAVKSINQDSSEDKINGAVSALDSQVKMIFESVKSAQMYAKSGFELVKHGNIMLWEQLTKAEERNEEREKKLENVEKEFEVLSQLVKTLMKA